MDTEHETKSQTKSSTRLKNDFPYAMEHGRFARQQADTLFKQTTNISHRTIIIGGTKREETGFYELIFNEKSGLSYKSFEKDYNKPNGNLSKIGIQDATSVHAFLSKNNKFIVCFDMDAGYNVYNIDEDCWLFASNASLSMSYYGASSTMINDSIIIISESYRVLFYYVPKLYSDHDTSNDDNQSDYKESRPVLVATRGFKTEPPLEYTDHGICLISYNYSINHDEKLTNDENETGSGHDYNYNYNYNYNYDSIGNNNEKMVENYSLKVVVFGGRWNSVFKDSFLQFDIALKIDDACKKPPKECLNTFNTKVLECILDVSDKSAVNETDHNEKKEKEKESDDGDKVQLTGKEEIDEKAMVKQFGEFGYQCVINSNKEPVIIIYGGYFTHEQVGFKTKSVFLFNTVTRQLSQIAKFLPYPCSDGIKMQDSFNTKIVVMSKQSYWYFDIFTRNLKWDIARLIWIGFHKNANNKDCFIASLPKDIVCHLLHFVGRKIPQSLRYSLESHQPYIKL